MWSAPEGDYVPVGSVYLRKLDADPVTVDDLNMLAIRAFDADQEKLAGCLYVIAEMCEEMRLDEVFGALLCFRRGDFQVENIDRDK
jgi:hypothetical protein